MPFVNYQRRPLVFNEMGKPINDLSMEDAIKEANKQNIANEREYQKARTAYSKEYNDWLDKIEDLQSRFNQYIITEKEKISKLKINVPDSLMETYKSIKALLAE